MLIGLGASSAHDQNGMTHSDMLATSRVANRFDEVIIFRSTGPWSKRWLQAGFPSKNFHVKGKSSDWGPHAGLVPYNGIYSKVGASPAKAAAGTRANDEGVDSGFADRRPLILTRQQMNMQLTDPAGRPARTAIDSETKIPGSADSLLMAYRSGDNKQIVFRACAQPDGRFEIRVYPPIDGRINSPFLVLDRDPKGLKAEKFLVMTSGEAGADLPMTGDYDLFAVCPAWREYGSQAVRQIAKPAITLSNGVVKPGQTFAAGVGMDNVLDPRLHTMSRAGDFGHNSARTIARATGGMGPLERHHVQQLEAVYAPGPEEHADVGNITPRILRCINELNVAMGAVGVRAAFRRVHHNAESHRFRTFGALTQHDMTHPKAGDQYGDGFPLTVFQPSTLYTGGRHPETVRFQDVCTLESLAEFNMYARALRESGFYVPRNWVWGP